jgi:hypothetical protein
MVAKVCLENVRCYVLGDAGALGDPFDDVLYRVRTNDPALIQREVRNRSGIGPNPDRSRGRVGGVSLDCTFLRGYAKNPYFWRRWAPTRAKWRLLSAKPSEPPSSRSRFPYRNAPKQASQATAADEGRAHVCSLLHRHVIPNGPTASLMLSSGTTVVAYATVGFRSNEDFGTGCDPPRWLRISGRRARRPRPAFGESNWAPGCAVPGLCARRFRCARVTCRISSGLITLAKAVNAFTSLR